MSGPDPDVATDTELDADGPIVDRDDPVTAAVETVALSAPEIRGGLVGRRRKAEGENPSGEEQLAADVWADELLEARLTAIDGIAQYASEEREGIVEAGDGDPSEAGASYAVTVDPLDGSSNLKPNNTMGTILGVYDAELPAKGAELVAAAYVLYGPITTMMVARDGEATEYVIDSEARRASDSRVARDAERPSDRASGDSGEQTAEPRDGDRSSHAERKAVREDVTLPDEPTVYGFGGRVPDWTDRFAAYADEVEDELKLRYGGAMIGDVNQVMTYGGIFAYPELESRPEGKLRLQFEGYPIGYLVETAGGRSSNGEASLLDVEPDELHQRTPVYVGNRDLIERLESQFA
ncbi:MULTISPECIES: class 1 fructose-bisphosphatase [Halorussus]|uniref:class 1 fructose-bisphosphatase n=1 Tax=Halorussus TaxID=1070314 RepID=UPI000E20E728|nr:MULTISPECIES: class 1 fructose-bisphosphatase [Halorussus]NHN59012.1 fructose-1,6-bisphosphatase [Halorussus sp. JP-T4]